tara:strand:+ start:410 stop:703 length:294 start_codon:yes stop_codon:yes gene_type:complete
MIVSVFLVISVVMNMLLVWYIRESIKRINNLWQTFSVFQDVLVEYYETLEKVYKMDIYYGEPVIENMIKKTSELLSLYDNLKYLTDEIVSGENNEKE